MKPATMEFLKQRFGEYYQKGFLTVPSALEQREWGFVFFDPSSEIRMRRHISFCDQQELTSYLRSMVPAHAYYSTAYYATPSAPTMNEKGWCGADLIFDIDADHIIRGAYDVMLERAREETIKLIAMLTDELGFATRDLAVVFSGGRGYHIHVKDIAVRGWGSHERREVIDYVCGTGISPGVLLRGGAACHQGWGRRYTDAAREYLGDVLGMERADALRRLTAVRGIGKTSAEALLERRDVIIDEIGRDPYHALTRNRAMQMIAASEEFRTILRNYAALADEPVTTDTRRLIRMPTSLHGGSGFRVTPLTISELHDFDPLIDAVTFGIRDVKIDMRSSLTIPLLGNTYALEEGISAVPEALAVFLCCRGLAEIAGVR